MTLATTLSGNVIDLLNPVPQDFEPRVIAHQLALLNRYGGATQMPYSVAQHSLLVETILADKGASRECRMWGLLHDVHEMLLGEIPAPAKQVLFVVEDEMPSPFDDVASSIDVAVAQAFGISPQKLQVFAPMVARADLVALSTEWRDLMPSPVPAGWPDPHPAPLKIMRWDIAEEKYLAALSRMRALI